MKTKYEHILISKEEYAFFLTLSDSERVNYLFGLYESSGTGTITAEQLAPFFQSVHDSLNDENKEPEIVEMPFPDSMHRVDVMIDDDNIMIEANSLKAIRSVVNRFMEVGYILKRDTLVEKMFRKDKVTKYLRVFYIIDKVNGICLN